MAFDIGGFLGDLVKGSPLGPLAIVPAVANTGVLGSGFSESMSEMPLVGGLFDDPREEDLKRNMLAAAQQYQAYRPELRDARVNATNQSLAAYQPAQRALIDMYGPMAYQDMTFADPFGAPPQNMITGGGNIAPPAGRS
jgi:hypothetical protein